MLALQISQEETNDEDSRRKEKEEKNNGYGIIDIVAFFLVLHIHLVNTIRSGRESISGKKPN